MDLYNYTYLNANGYLKKFQNALGMPNLDRAFLTKALQIFNKRYKLKGFIAKDDKGYNALYYKDTLNAILGIDRTGFEITKPEHNLYLKWLNDIIEDEERREFEKTYNKNTSATKREEPINYSSDEEDMEKVSQQLIDYQNVMESKKHIAILTESQFKNYVLFLKEEQEMKYPVDTEKVGIVKKYLDENFIKGGIPCMGEDGYPITLPIVAMKGTDGNPIKNMSDKQLFALLLDKFGKIYSDVKQTKRFLRQIMKDWYYGKISKENLLSVNQY